MSAFLIVSVMFVVVAVPLFLLRPRERDYLLSTQALLQKLPQNRLHHLVQFIDKPTPAAQEQAWQVIGGYKGLRVLLVQSTVLVRLLQLYRFTGAIMPSDAADVWKLSRRQFWATARAYVQLPIYALWPRGTRIAALHALQHHWALTLRVRTLLQLAGASGSVFNQSALL